MMRRWVQFWDRREDPVAMACVRILLCLVLLYDLLAVAWHGLPILLWAPAEIGGVHDVLARAPEKIPWVYRLFAPSSATVWGLYYTVLASLVCFGAGVLTRFSGLVLLLSYAQMAIINDQADRGIDRMLRIMILLLVCSGSGRALSISAKWKTGRWFGDGTTVPAWPRYLMIFQLVVMYWCAGVEKFAVTWFPWGGYSALYYILQDPIFAVTDFSFLASPWLYPLTQLGTAGSHMWEWTCPVLLLAYYYRSTPSRPGRLRHFFLKWDVRLIYVLVGLTFHVLLACTLHLGIFPAAMLALYPAFFHPQEILGFVRKWRRTSER